jgi:hypothetical protein
LPVYKGGETVLGPKNLGEIFEEILDDIFEEVGDVFADDEE